MADAGTRLSAGGAILPEARPAPEHVPDKAFPEIRRFSREIPAFSASFSGYAAAASGDSVFFRVDGAGAGPLDAAGRFVILPQEEKRRKDLLEIPLAKKWERH